MADRSNIEWCDASWTPIRARNLKTGKIGWHCEHDTTGCEFCYAEGMNKRLGTGLPFKPGHRKDIEIFLDDEMLRTPLRWKKPRKIFVCSMTDLFAEFVSDEWLDKMFTVMALCPQHTFQVLTKRAERMRDYCAKLWGQGIEAEMCARYMAQYRIWMQLPKIDQRHLGCRVPRWPLPNVWFGVSCERQQEADERIPLLLQTPAALRFVSLEPLLGPIDLTVPDIELGIGRHGVHTDLDWVIVGGESGKNARPMHPQWVRDIRDQCGSAGVKFFFKQWGGFTPNRACGGVFPASDLGTLKPADTYGRRFYALPRTMEREEPEGCIGLFDVMERVGKKAAGRQLDGRTWDEFPEVSA